MSLFHNVPAYFKSPAHPITIHLVGVGGTGSRMLVKLAEIHQALIALGHRGLMVIAYDPDKVSEHNIGRQGFYPVDIGLNKAEVLISRINRSFGLVWKGIPVLYKATNKANVVITCVDTVQIRTEIGKQMRSHRLNAGKKERLIDEDLIAWYSIPYYWLDLGNSRFSGQVILGTAMDIRQPEGLEEARGMLPHVMDHYPDLLKKEDKSAPSCSMAEALLKQDLCINDVMATYGKILLWSLFRHHRIRSCGVYVNLETLNTNPIPIPDDFERYIPKRKVAKKDVKTPVLNKRKRTGGNRPARPRTGVNRPVAVRKGKRKPKRLQRRPRAKVKAVRRKNVRKS